MSSFEVETTIEAPVDEVWRVLADVGAIDRWNPGVRSSHTTTGQATGLGAARHCVLGGKNYLKEEVVVWEPGGRLTMRITDTNLPFHAADIRFALWSEGDTTRVSVSPDYRLRYGGLGKSSTGCMSRDPTGVEWRRC